MGRVTQAHVLPVLQMGKLRPREVVSRSLGVSYKEKAEYFEGE